MLTLLLILIVILIIIIYYELRVSTSKLPIDVFRLYDFSQKKFIGREVFVIKPMKHEDIYEPEPNETSWFMLIQEKVLYRYVLKRKGE